MKRLFTALALTVLAASSGAVAQTDDAAALCADPQAACAQMIAPACLSRVGAGSVAAAPPGCEAQMTAYSGCLQQVAEKCGGPAESAGHEVPEEHLKPILTPMLVTACYKANLRQLLCGGAAGVLHLSLFDPKNDPELFRSVAVQAFTISGGAVSLLKDLANDVDRSAIGRSEFKSSIDAAPSVMGICYSYQRDGESKGVVQAFRLKFPISEQLAKMQGQASLLMNAVSQPTEFDPAATNCETAMAALAKRRGL